MVHPGMFTTTTVLNRYFSHCLALLLVLLCPLSAMAYDTVRLQLKWAHHFQFAGYYAAKEKGYYQQAGLNVEFLPGGPGIDPLQKVLEGKAEFGVGATDLLLRREQGAPVVVLAAIFQHSPLALMSLKKNGSNGTHSLSGNKIMIEPGSTELEAYLHSEGVTPDKYLIQTPKFHGWDLFEGTVDTISGSVIGEMFPLSKTGKEYQIDSPRSAGIDFYGDNLFTIEKQIRMRPERVRAFRAASLKGWEYAMQHPEELVQLIHSRYSVGHSIEHLRFEASQLKPLVQSPLIEIGHMNPGRWRHIADVYARMGKMKPGFNLDGFLYDSKPPPPDLRLIYATLVATLSLALIVTLIAVRFSRLSAALRSTIADHKRVGDALQESESLYRSILNASPDSITILDINGSVKMVSPAGVSMFGYEQEEELLGLNVVELISAEDRERAASNIQLMLQGTFSGVGDYTAVRRDGSKFDIEAKGQYIRPADGKPAIVVFIIRDISERKQSNDTCLMAMGEMVCAIAHQWRQPLATLGMIVQRTHALGSMPEGFATGQLDEFKTNAMRQIKYMSNTIDEFRGFYRPEKEKVLFSPYSCIDDAVKLFEPQFSSSRIAVAVSCRDCEGTLVNGYPKEFKQVILNLLGNARDAILEIRSVKGEPEQGNINVKISVREDMIMNIDISDNGCGIPPEIASRILEPYFTTKEESGGTGLGLYMSRTIVEKSLEGRLRLIQCYEGATFRIELPLGGKA